MDIGNKVNWLVTSECNLSCKYCFSPENKGNSTGDILGLAGILADSDIKKVTLSGGEPTLVDSLGDVVKTLHNGGIYVSLHTNGYFLTREKLEGMAPYIGDIALPIDSMNVHINDGLRDRGSLEISKRVLRELNDAGVDAGIHTVATSRNIEGLKDIYNYISEDNFSYWKIYEENERPVSGERCSSGADGDVDDFFGDFLVAEKKMYEVGDKRINFIANEDKMPYLFLNNNGEIGYHPSFFQSSKSFGNILETGMGEIVEKVSNFIGQDSEEFFAERWELPLWVRYYSGACFPEEIEEIAPEHVERFLELSELYAERGEMFT